jgi:hypothetical protein
VKARPLRHDHVAAVRGVLHGAMALYLARYINVPNARPISEPAEVMRFTPARECDALARCACELVHTVGVA